MPKNNTAVLSVMAQEDNLGDIEIREKLFHSVASTGIDILGFRGTSSDSYVEAFAGAPNCRWFKSALSLQGALFTRFLKGDRLHFFIAPGPARFSSKPKAIAKSLVNFTNMALARLSGGTVHVVGRAYRGTGLTRYIEMGCLSLATTATVRDELSKKNVGGRADALPDLAFYGEPFFEGGRTHLAICVREESDLNETVFENLISAARSIGLTPVFVVQVKRDNSWMKRMAALYGTELVDWDEASHQQQRSNIEAVYRRSRVVVSNRLHGLIMGSMAGAQPLPLISKGNTKLLPTLQLVFKSVEGMSAKQLADIEPNSLSRNLSTWNFRIQNNEMSLACGALSQHLKRVESDIGF